MIPRDDDTERYNDHDPCIHKCKWCTSPEIELQEEKPAPWGVINEKAYKAMKQQAEAERELLYWRPRFKRVYFR